MSDSSPIQISPPTHDSSQDDSDTSAVVYGRQRRRSTIIDLRSGQSSMSAGENQTPAGATENNTESCHTDTATDQTTRPPEDRGRSRGMSRCSSVPTAMHLTPFQGTSTSPPTSADGKSTRNSTSSVKHLTCFWWKEKGSCRFSDEDCLYAHYDTGHHTAPPRQLIPGEPALAGRKLDRAMRNLAITNRSSGSLSSLPSSHNQSRCATPVFEHRSPLPSPFPILLDFELARLNNDSQFLKSIIDQNGKDKAIFINTLDALQAENKGMKSELDGLRKAQEQLLIEREGLRAHIEQLEHQQMSMQHINHSYGVIGRPRVNTERRYLGGLLDNE